MRNKGKYRKKRRRKRRLPFAINYYQSVGLDAYFETDAENLACTILFIVILVAFAHKIYLYHSLMTFCLYLGSIFVGICSLLFDLYMIVLKLGNQD